MMLWADQMLFDKVVEVAAVDSKAAMKPWALILLGTIFYRSLQYLTAEGENTSDGFRTASHTLHPPKQL